MPNTWNYRVIRHKNGYGLNTSDYLQIHEVHYENGVAVAVSKNAAGIGGDDIAEIDRVLTKFRLALNSPILDYDTFC